MEQPNVQQLFFAHIRNNLPTHLSFVDDISETLSVSNDSAYRRIRGEKQISFEEIQKLALRYKISLDQLLHLQSDSFIFSGKLRDEGVDFFGQYLNDLLQRLTALNAAEHRHLYFLSKDIPWLSLFQIPELASFKIFLWMKSILYYPELKGVPFSLKNPLYPAYLKLGEKIFEQFNRMPATEIWNLDCISTTIQQIDYYRQCNLFESDADIAVIYDKLEMLIDHTEKQAEAGKKFGIGKTATENSPAFHLFYNELALGDNTVVVDLGKIKIAFLNHSVIDFISTRDERFCNQLFETLVNLIRKSTQISLVGEKNRSQFFHRLRSKINDQRRLLHAGIR